MGILITYEDGNRLEDVMRTVISITPTDTPFMSGIQKCKAFNTLHQWPRDTLTTRQDNAKIEGGSFSYGSHTPPTRSDNVTQIFDKSVNVSSTERWVKQAGINDMFEYELLKATKAIATDIEHALLRGSKATGNASVARRLAGALNYISTNATAVVSGTKLTESFFAGLSELAWIAGGDPDEVYVGSRLKRIISQYSAGLTKNVEAKDNRLINSIDVYEGDFGLQKIFLTRDFVSTANACQIVIIENARWKMAIGEEVHELPKEQVAQDVHGTKGMIRGEITLEALAEEANAKATGLDNTFN